jgi:acetyl-CoA acyltransferase
LHFIYNQDMKDAFIIDGVRTAIGNFGGTLSTVRTDDLAAFVLKKLMEKNASIDPAAINEIILGCANQAGEDNRNVARMALLLAGLPYSIPAETVNRLCASGLSASVAAARSIMLGDADLVIAGGVENMTRGPWVMSKASAPFGRDQQLYDSSFGWRFIHPKMKEMYGVDAMVKLPRTWQSYTKYQEKIKMHSPCIVNKKPQLHNLKEGLI